MKEKIPRNIKELSKNNIYVLKVNKIKRDDLVGDLANSIKVGYSYLSNIFLKNNINIDFDKKIHKDKTKDVSLEKKMVISDILRFDPDFIIVRPEMFHMTEKICDFLKKNNFRINFLIEKIISLEEYFNLYKKIIRSVPNFKLSLPSRTLVYTNAKSSIIVFTKNINHLDKNTTHLADFFSDKFKGKEGEKSENTIRGDIIYNEALRLGFDKMIDPVIAMAIDPFATYSELIKKRTGDFYHLKTSSELYALMYTAQGIHCPTYAELPGDLASILSLDQLLKLKSNLKKQND